MFYSKSHILPFRNKAISSVNYGMMRPYLRLVIDVTDDNHPEWAYELVSGPQNRIARNL